MVHVKLLLTHLGAPPLFLLPPQSELLLLLLLLELLLLLLLDLDGHSMKIVWLEFALEKRLDILF